MTSIANSQTSAPALRRFWSRWPSPSSSVASPTHEHERHDHRHQPRPEHHGPGRAGLAHPFPLVMAALIIPCGNLTDHLGRKRCFLLGLSLYRGGGGAQAASPGIGVLILGNSIFEGVGTALLIPPVYILTTLLFSDIKSHAWAFGVISGMGGVGATGRRWGPDHHGDLVASRLVFQAIIIIIILLLGRGVTNPLPANPTPLRHDQARVYLPSAWSCLSGGSWPPTPMSA